MKRLFNIVLAVMMALAFVSCDEPIVPEPEKEPEEEKKEDKDKTDTGLVAETSVTVYTAQEFTEAMAERLRTMSASLVYEKGDDIMNDVSEFAVNAFTAAMELNYPLMDMKYSGRQWFPSRDHKWQIERHCFTYRSVSYTGEPIELSGCVTFPRSTASDKSALSSISLYSHYFVSKPANAPSLKLDIVQSRVFYNSAVVMPDFEGYGSTADRQHSGSVYDVLARQAIDCELAAIELMKGYGVELEEKGYTDNWGLSLAAPTALAVQKYLENEASKKVAAQINLNSTFCADGPFDVPSIMRYMDEYPDFNQVLILPLTNSVMVVPEKELKGYNRDDFWNPDLKKDYMDTTSTVSIYDEIFVNKNYGKLLTSSIPLKIGYYYPEDMLTEDGSFDMESPKTEVMLDIVQNHSSSSGWVPRHPLYMSQNKKDNFIPYQQAYDTFEDLSLFSDDVSFVTTDIPESMEDLDVHTFSCLMNEIHVILFESPEQVYQAQLREKSMFDFSDFFFGRSFSDAFKK